MNILKPWMLKATKAEKQRLADLAGISLGYLYQLGAGYLKPSTELQQKLIIVAELMHNESRYRLPRLSTEDLPMMCPLCKQAIK